MAAVRERKYTPLAIAGVLMIIMGFVISFIAVYFMFEVTQMGIPGDVSEEKYYQYIKFMNIACILVIVEGVFDVVIGFFAAINAGQEEYAGKCRKYGVMALAVSLLNFAVIFMVSRYGVSQLVVGILMVPVGISVFYLLMALLNVRVTRTLHKETDHND